MIALLEALDDEGHVVASGEITLYAAGGSLYVQEGSVNLTALRPAVHINLWVTLAELAARVPLPPTQHENIQVGDNVTFFWSGPILTVNEHNE